MRRLAVLTLAVVVFAACGGGGSSATSTTKATPAISSQALSDATESAAAAQQWYSERSRLISLLIANTADAVTAISNDSAAEHDLIAREQQDAATYDADHRACLIQNPSKACLDALNAFTPISRAKARIDTAMGDAAQHAFGNYDNSALTGDQSQLTRIGTEPHERDGGVPHGGCALLNVTTVNGANYAPRRKIMSAALTAASSATDGATWL